MKPLLSIIIPTLNEELYLPKLLSDLAEQKEKNFEVIVVDGGSTDRTIKCAQEFKKKIVLNIFEAKQKNVSFQKNYGASKASGDFLIFLDADIRVGNSFSKNLNKEIKKSKYLVFIPKAVPQGGTYGERMMVKLADMAVELSHNLPKPLPTAGCSIFKKSLFNHIGGFTQSKNQDKGIHYPEDHDLLLKAVRSGVKSKYLPNVKIRFSVRRLKKEGVINVTMKYIVSGIEMSLKGRLDKKIEYEMGGHLYRKK